VPTIPGGDIRDIYIRIDKIKNLIDILSKLKENLFLLFNDHVDDVLVVNYDVYFLEHSSNEMTIHCCYPNVLIIIIECRVVWASGNCYLLPVLIFYPIST
jgi:hypothetical protein